MSVSIIWKLSEKEKENQITFENIREQIAENKQSVQILIYANACDNGKKYGSGLEQTGAKTQLCAYEGTDTEIYADAQDIRDSTAPLQNILEWRSSAKDGKYQICK